MRSKVQQVLKAAVAQVQAAIQQSTAAASAGNGGANGSSSSSLALASASGPASASNGGRASGSNGSLAGAGSGGLAGGGGGQGQVPQLAEGADVPLLYVRFRAAAEPQLKGLLREVELRAGRPEYSRLQVMGGAVRGRGRDGSATGPSVGSAAGEGAGGGGAGARWWSSTGGQRVPLAFFRPHSPPPQADCHQMYGAARLQLVGPYVQQRLQQYATAQPLPVFTRNGCEHLIRVGGWVVLRRRPLRTFGGDHLLKSWRPPCR